MTITYRKNRRAKPFEMVFNNVIETLALINSFNESNIVKNRGKFFIYFDIKNKGQEIYFKHRTSINGYLPPEFQCFIEQEAVMNNPLYNCLKTFFIRWINRITIGFKPPVFFDKNKIKDMDLIKIYKLYKFFVNWNDEPFTRKNYFSIFKELVKSESFIL